jgi:uncharacterized delta-60 repeat protein
VTRLNTNGSIDRTFNQANSFNRDGKLIATLDPVSWSSSLNNVTLQRDGKIVLAGTAGKTDVYGAQQFVLVRLNSDGWFDRSFGDRGKVVTGFGGDDSAFDVVQSSDGGLIAGGSVNGRLSLVGYTADGKLNTNFGIGGRVKLEGHGNAPAYLGRGGLATAPGRGLVIAGGYGFATARLFDNPAFDPRQIDKSTVRRGFSMTTTPAQSESPQAATRDRDLFSSERIDALQTL